MTIENVIELAKSYNETHNDDIKKDLLKKLRANKNLIIDIFTSSDLNTLIIFKPLINSILGYFKDDRLVNALKKHLLELNNTSANELLNSINPTYAKNVGVRKIINADYIYKLYEEFKSDMNIEQSYEEMTGNISMEIIKYLTHDKLLTIEIFSTCPLDFFLNLSDLDYTFVIQNVLSHYDDSIYEVLKNHIQSFNNELANQRLIDVKY